LSTRDEDGTLANVIIPGQTPNNRDTGFEVGSEGKPLNSYLFIDSF
jgi:hypothetical protein